MAKQVTGDALDTLNRTLGLPGAGSAAVTELNDGQVDQTLDVAPFVRRGRTWADSEGIFRFVLENGHGGAGTLSTSIFPYAPAVGSVAPYPLQVPEGYDIWLLKAAVQVTTSFAGACDALLAMNNVKMGIGEDDAGAAVTTNTVVPLALWLSPVSFAGVTFLRNGSFYFEDIGVRVPRSQGATGNNVAITLQSTADGAVDATCTILAGIFPSGLGQDVVPGR